MAEGNHLCETENCVNPASAFGLKGTLKLRTCDAHITSLLAKQMTIYTIDRYTFISTQQHAVLFEERKAAVEKGLENLAAQETSIEAEFAEALHLLESERTKLLRVVEALCDIIREAVTTRHSEVKRELASLRVNFAHYLQSPGNVLKPSAELLCAELRSNPRFLHLILDGISVVVSKVASKYWSVSGTGVESLLKSAVSASPMPATLEAAQECYQKAEKHYSSQQYRDAEECYNQAKALYSTCAPRSTDAATNLNDFGLLLTDLERWSEAEECHKQALSILQGAESSEAARNSLNYGWLCYCVGRMEEAEGHYQHALRVYRAAGVQTKNEGVTLRNLGLVRYDQARYKDAEELFTQAQRVLDKVDPQCIDAGKNWVNQGLVCAQLHRWRESEENYTKAKRIYEVEAPQSSLLADCLYNMALLYEAQGRVTESVAAFRSAGTLYALNDDEAKADVEESLLRVQLETSRE